MKEKAGETFQEIAKEGRKPTKEEAMCCCLEGTALGVEDIKKTLKAIMDGNETAFYAVAAGQDDMAGTIINYIRPEIEKINKRIEMLEKFLSKKEIHLHF